jgi:HNH endonuclease
MGKFKGPEFERLLAACHRCCCICHRFCGVKMEIDHIIQQAEKGPDTYENAIPVCFECHAEIHSYNLNHPRGRKFQPDELRAHREQWLTICKEHPEIFRRGSFARAEVGPLQSLIDELEFNEAVATAPSGPDQFCLFKERQFLEAVRAGSVATLQDGLKRSINEAYVQMGQTNHLLNSMASQTHPSMLYELGQRAAISISKARQPIHSAKQELLKFLGSES